MVGGKGIIFNVQPDGAYSYHWAVP